MKNDDFSILGIFQDPLTTIIGLVLLGTVWMIIPTETKPVEAKVYLTLEEINFLKNEIASLEEKVRQLEAEIQRRKDEIKWLERRLAEEKKKLDEEKYAGNAEQINMNIAEIKSELEKKNAWLKRIEEELKKAKEELLKAKGRDESKAAIAIIKLKNEIKKKKEQLEELEKKIKAAEQEKEKTSDMKDSQKKLIAQLQSNLKEMLVEIEKLKAKLEQMENKAGSGGRFNPIFPSEKKPLYIELVNNRLFPVDDDHYEAKYGYLKIEDGRTVQASKKTRKSSSGEHINKIGDPDSDLNKTLEKLNSSEERIIFLVHKDSFEIFRKARTIALKKGIEIGWWPREGDSITLTYGGGGEDIGSTNK